jgi:transposase
MNPREQRGLELVERVNIQPVGKGIVGKWVVPSSTGSGRYLVDLNSTSKRCDCPDYEQRRCKCKHIFAVEHFVKRSSQTETDSTGLTTVTETVTKVKRTTYKQNWPAYNTAQTQEKATFQALLSDLCQSVPDMETKAGKSPGGRSRLPLSEMIFAAAFKVYSTVSGRRFMCDLSDAHGRGYLSKLPHYNSIFNYLEMKELTPLLTMLIERSSLALQSLETDFAVDSSGFSTCRTVTWFNARYGHEQDNHDWLKLHLMCGVKTNVVTSARITERYSHDSLKFAPLVTATARSGFVMNEVSADKAYSSRSNLRAVENIGGTPFIPFKSNVVGTAHKVPRATKEACRLWEKMYHYYNLNRDEFLQHYHKRSNVESTFAMIKAKFGGSLRSKTDVAMRNEALCKVLCHNICCVIQSMHEFGIEPTFALN